MAKGYTSAAVVASYMGQAFSAGQAAWATQLLDPAETFIDLYTRNSWSPQPVAIIAEPYDLLRDWLILRSTPVASVQAVLVRTRAIGDAGRTLVAGTDYELQDPASGLLVLAQGERGGLLGEQEEAGYPEQQEPIGAAGAPQDIARSYALVSYTASAPVPPDVAQATTMLVAHWMAANVDPTRFEAQRLKIGQRTVEFEAAGIPAPVKEILDLRQRAGIFG